MPGGGLSVEVPPIHADIITKREKEEMASIVAKGYPCSENKLIINAVKFFLTRAAIFCKRRENRLGTIRKELMVKGGVPSFTEKNKKEVNNYGSKS